MAVNIKKETTCPALAEEAPDDLEKRPFVAAVIAQISTQKTGVRREGLNVK